MMRIVIDMQGAQNGSRGRGIGRYTLAMAQAIVMNRGGHEILLALNGLFPDTLESLRAAFDGLLPQENIRVWYSPGPVLEKFKGNDPRRLVAERIREAFLFSLEPDVVYVPSLFEGYFDDAVTSIGTFTSQIPTVVTVHDLIPLLNPETHFKKNRAFESYYKRKIEYLKRAHRWLAVSRSAAGELADALAFPAERVAITHEGASPVFRPVEITANEKRDFFCRFNITHPFILCVGACDPHKNLRRLIRAYARLPKKLRDSYQLVFVGGISENDIARLRKIGGAVGIGGGQMIFSGHIPDEVLVRFYSLCEVFVLPSLHEGFGLTALEAMSCGAAVIGSNKTSVPEVIGWEDALFNPYSESAIAGKLTEALTQDVFRAELKSRGLERVKQFSWDECARRAIVTFEALHASPSGKEAKDDAGDLMCRLVPEVTQVVPSNISDTELADLACALSKIQQGAAPRQLFVDISELVKKDIRTGVQRVTRSVLKELLEHPPRGFVVRPVYATIEEKGYFYATQCLASFQGLCSDRPDELIDYRPGDTFLGLDLQPDTTRAQAGYLSSLYREGVSVYFVVHDLLPLHFPQYFSSESSGDRVHREWMNVIARFDGVVCVSRAVSVEFTEWLAAHGPKRLRPLKISWSHNGADFADTISTSGLPDDSGYVLAELARRPTFMTVGTLEPRKGHAQLLGAFELLWKQGVDINLVIIGNQGWMVEALVKRLRCHFELNKRLFWLEGISDEYLEKIYDASACLIAASEGEGFGLPLVEAARHKLPIIARDIPVFREVASDHAFFFSGLDAKQLVEAVNNWLMLRAVDKVPRSTGIPWLTWRESTQRLLEKILPEGGESADPRFYTRRLIFDHQMKTAGMAVTDWLRNELGSGCVTESIIGDHQDLIQCYGGDYPIISAHLKFRGEGLDPKYQYITLLREPIDRAISWLFFVLKNHTLEQWPEIYRWNQDFVLSDGSRVHSGYLPYLQDTCTHHFVSVDHANALLTDDEKVEIAFSTIKKYNAVGLYEEMPEFLADVAELVEIPIPKDIARVNATFSRPAVDQISSALRQKIVELNQLDIRLYQKVAAWKKAQLPKERKTRAVSPWEKYAPSRAGNSFEVREFQGSLTPMGVPEIMKANEQLKIAVMVTNAGDQLWQGDRFHPVKLSYHWYDQAGYPVRYNGLRTSLPDGGIGPYSSLNSEMHVLAPAEPGRYSLTLTLVQERVCWFESKGFKSHTVELTVI